MQGLENSKNLNSFISYWSNHSKFRKMPNGNRLFEAKISYEFGDKEIDGKTTVSIEIDGYNAGNIHLYEKGVFDANIFHLDFSPDFQGYSFNKKAKVLVIEGDSDKMYGEYKVTIMPLV